jgi:hypothetical protein
LWSNIVHNWNFEDPLSYRVNSTLFGDGTATKDGSKINILDFSNEPIGRTKPAIKLALWASLDRRPWIAFARWNDRDSINLPRPSPVERGLLTSVENSPTPREPMDSNLCPLICGGLSIKVADPVDAVDTLLRPFRCWLPGANR